MTLGLAQAKVLNDARRDALPKEPVESYANAIANSGTSHCESSDSESKLHVSVMSYKRVELQR